MKEAVGEQVYNTFGDDEATKLFESLCLQCELVEF